MNAHEEYLDLLPWYAAGQLEEAGRAEIEMHLKACPECRAELALWQGIRAEVVAGNQGVVPPSGAAERALAVLQPAPARPASRRSAFSTAKPLGVALKRAGQLLWAQAPLIQRDLWPAAALVMGIGFVISVLSNALGTLRVLAPLMAAASLAVIYGPEHDPAAELALSTPTSPWKILLARVTLVFGYNLALALVASFLMLAFVPGAALSLSSAAGLILAWLAPMTFLSALALALSVWVGTANALVVAYVGWLAQFLPTFIGHLALADGFRQVMMGYAHFWQSPGILLVAGGLLFGLALLRVQAPARGLGLGA